MSDYTRTTDFSAKDSLPKGDPNKVIKGSEFQTEFNNLETAIGTKANKIVSGTSGNVITQDASGDLVDSGISPAQLMPTGAIIQYGASTAPSGWLNCDGSAVSRSIYSDLYSAIGTAFGAGDGSTTFNLPDFKGRTPIGIGTGTGLTARSMGANGGAETHTLTTSEMPSHGHTISIGSAGGHSHTGTTDSDGAHTHSISREAYKNTGTGTGNFVRTNNDLLGTVTITSTSDGAHTHTFTTGTVADHSHTATASSTGGGGAHNNMQPFLAVNYIIKT